MKKILVLFAVVGLMMGTISAHANLVTNGGFESGLTGWSLSGEDSHFFGSGHTGAQSLELFDNSGFATLSQMITTTVGATYDFSFWSAVYSVVPGNILRYSLDSGPIVTVAQASGGFNWEYFSDSFVASSTSTAISFFIETDPGTGTWKLDDVYVSLGENPVPEPTTMLLFGTGIAGLAAIGRRKK
ncbi:PEP-CTERM sorting domain-containing protein [Desulfogranum mediterraneum]|uniref:PEP-CTERM sorting domain-containing protein n=1 Tax=Desulfogranum mediterraneum TaxID=160661 RepID=UPI0004208D87|nr:PEP-CTERM sorting domain-containing protein [Desulfogranum mediterraneum]